MASGFENLIKGLKDLPTEASPLVSDAQKFADDYQKAAEVTEAALLREQDAVRKESPSL